MEEDARFQAGANGEWLAVGRQGWVYWHTPRWYDVRLGVTALIGRERLVVTTLLLELPQVDVPTQIARGESGGLAIHATDLRNLPLGRMEEVINTSHISGRVRSLMGMRRGPDYSPTRCPPGQAYLRSKDLPLVTVSSDLTLPVATSRSNSDEFYVGLASAYARAVVVSDRPVEALAEANDVPKATVNRWLREARRLGAMAPARRGDH